MRKQTGSYYDKSFIPCDESECYPIANGKQWKDPFPTRQEGEQWGQTRCRWVWCYRTWSRWEGPVSVVSISPWNRGLEHWLRAAERGDRNLKRTVNIWNGPWGIQGGELTREEWMDCWPAKLAILFQPVVTTLILQEQSAPRSVFRVVLIGLRSHLTSHGGDLEYRGWNSRLSVWLQNGVVLN